MVIKFKLHSIFNDFYDHSFTIFFFSIGLQNEFKYILSQVRDNAQSKYTST